MNTDTLFIEKQRFHQWWLWLILLGINGFFLFGIYQQLIRGLAFGDHPMSDSGLLMTAGILILSTLLFLCLKLETVIKKDGIHIRFFPFHIAFKHYRWDTLTKCYIRQYSPIAEYGGWGLRYGIMGKGSAYNVSGDMGLQLEFMDNKKILIGTNKPHELSEVLKTIGQLKQ